MTIAEYLATLRKSLAHGDATEHTHRPALKTLLESLNKGIVATNEPKRIACGAPDFILTRKGVPLGHIETKDIGTNLDQVERGQGPHGGQFQRYRDALPNWVLTNYLDFRWYVDGEKRLSASLASFGAKGKIQETPNGASELTKVLDAFLSQTALTVESAKDLARRMAGMTRILRDLIAATFGHGSNKDRQQLTNWISAFKEVLLPDLTEQEFADMFAQTLAYGLFAARVHSLQSEVGFSREMAAYSLPRTNPFLRKLFSEIAGVDMPDTFGWAVDDLVQLLKFTNWGKVLQDFGKGKAKHDPVVHFYETFLAAYDPKTREIRGVYYTPEPVVSYIVRSTEHLLKTRFNKAKGLADEKTLILDPAVGTATFLFFVVQQIYAQFAKQKGIWDGYVAEHLLNRVFGFELLMAPYAVAHLKLGMELQETGYTFQSEQRLGIYLTNTLEEAAKRSEKLFARWISDEANAAAEIKRDRPILVIIGNPPYSGHSANRSRSEDGGLTFIGGLIEDYKRVDGKPLKEKNPKWLQDDYVKFIRFAQWRIERTGHGILGFITNHGYLDNPTFRGMRQSLMETFNTIYVYDLHGNSKKKERAPDGAKDENVFDIQQGVAILLAVKEPNHTEDTFVHHCDLWGIRKHKYEILSEHDVTRTSWVPLSPKSPDYLFTPVTGKLRDEYENALPLPQILTRSSIGIVTARDSLTIHFTPDEVWDTVHGFVSLPVEEAREKYQLGTDVVDWSVAAAQSDLRNTGPDKKHIVPILYRPFDVRYTYFTGRSRGFHCRPRQEIMQDMLAGGNLGLITTRTTKDMWDCHICNVVMGHKALAAYDPNYLFPLYHRAQGTAGQDSLQGFGPELQLTFSGEFLTRVSEALGYAQDAAGFPDPETVLGYIYAVFHSVGYRSRYMDFLKRDFPRLPLTSSESLFYTLSELGTSLIDVHLLRFSGADDYITEFPVKGDNTVNKISYRPEHQRLWINAQQYFGGLSAEIWETQVGGYQVCEKWLQDRKGRQLTYADVQHWQRIVVALAESKRIMQEIDGMIPEWPLA